MPWYWQGITGLDTAIKKYEGFRTSPYRGGSDSILTINTLESVDMVIEGMNSLYKKAVDDQKYRREILPDNLRKFDFYVFINDIRKFQVSSAALQTPPKPAPHDDFKANLPRVIIKFTGCKFVHHDNSTLYESVSNNSAEMANNSISIKYDDIEVTTDVPWFEYNIEASGTPGEPLRTSSGNADDSIFKKIAKATAKAALDQAKKMGRRALLSAKKLVIEELKRLILANIKLPWNNVYGGAFGALSNFANGGIGRQIAGDLLSKTPIGDNAVLNNIFGLNGAANTGPDVGDNALNGGRDSYIDVANSNIGFPTETDSYVKMNLNNIYE